MTSGDYHPNGARPEVRGPRSRVPTVPNRRGPESNLYKALPFFGALVFDVGTGVLFNNIVDKHFLHGAIEQNVLPQFQPFLEIAVAGIPAGYGMYRLTKAVVNR